MYKAMISHNTFHLPNPFQKTSQLIKVHMMQGHCGTPYAHPLTNEINIRMIRNISRTTNAPES